MLSLNSMLRQVWQCCLFAWIHWIWIRQPAARESLRVDPPRYLYNAIQNLSTSSAVMDWIASLSSGLEQSNLVLKLGEYCCCCLFSRASSTTCLTLNRYERNADYPLFDEWCVAECGFHPRWPTRSHEYHIVLYHLPIHTEPHSAMRNSWWMMCSETCRREITNTIDEFRNTSFINYSSLHGVVLCG